MIYIKRTQTHYKVHVDILYSSTVQTGYQIHTRLWLYNIEGSSFIYLLVVGNSFSVITVCTVVLLMYIYGARIMYVCMQVLVRLLRETSKLRCLTTRNSFITVSVGKK